MVDWDGKYSIFGQLMTRFGSMQGRSFRVGKNGRMFKVYLEGEGSQDLGGPYRDVMENLCKELKSDHLPLFELCANGKDEIGENRDAYIPAEMSANERYRKSQIKMYEFLGQLFGLAIRSLGYLNLSLAPFVWKRILGDNLTVHDIWSVDQGTARLLQSIGKNDEEVPELRIGNGELVKGTKENKAKIMDYHLKKYEEQCEAMRRGLACVVPIGLCSLFTMTELEEMVCGEKVTDLKLLKKKTS
jgi:hypothetical protein